MFEKLGIPENCIKNLNIPLNKIFSNEYIDKYQIKNCKLYASINYELLDIQKTKKSDSRYDEIHFVFIEIGNLFVHSDLHRIVREIFRTIKYQVIVIIHLENMYKIAASSIIPGKIISEDNIVKNYLFTKWLFPDEESFGERELYNNLSELFKTVKNIPELYKSIYIQLSHLIEDHNYSYKRLKQVLEDIRDIIDGTDSFESEILNSIFALKMYKHSNGNKYQTSDDDTQEIYAPECIEYTLNRNKQVIEYCKKINKNGFAIPRPKAFRDLPEEFFMDFDGPNMLDMGNPVNYNSDNLFARKKKAPKIWDDPEAEEDCDWEDEDDWYPEEKNKKFEFIKEEDLEDPDDILDYYVDQYYASKSNNNSSKETEEDDDEDDE